MKVAMIGLGAIGQAFLKCLSASAAGVQVMGALVAQHEKRRDATCPIFANLDALLATGPDLVIECARQPVLRDLGPRVLASGKCLLVTSVGALAEPSTQNMIVEAARTGGAQLFIPAGALAGIDALAAATQIGVNHVRYQRRAPPSTWVKSGAINTGDLVGLQAPRPVFEGSAREAAIRYPKNANVAATIALAGIGFDRTHVTLLADPSVTCNVHSIEAEGAFGRFHAEIAAHPISADSTSSGIVAGSLAHAVVSRVARIAVV